MIIIAKFCKRCGKPIYGKARKWCPNCKRENHLEQMHQNYIDNTKNWQFGGKYYEKQSFGKCGTGSLGEHSTLNWNLEMKKIEKEKLNLGLQDKKEHWRYKNDR